MELLALNAWPVIVCDDIVSKSILMALKFILT